MFAKESDINEKSKEDVELLKLALSEYREEYKEACEIWKTLETKAQIAMTVSGVFLAATLNFASKASVAAGVNWLIGLSMFCLSLAFFSALLVLRVQKYNAPFDGDALKLRFEELLVRDGDDSYRLRQFLLEVSKLWVGVSAEMDAINDRKQWWLSNAYFFVTSTVIFVFFSILQQFSSLPLF